jgi:hypothetical protein
MWGDQIALMSGSLKRLWATRPRSRRRLARKTCERAVAAGRCQPRQHLQAGRPHEGHLCPGARLHHETGAGSQAITGRYRGKAPRRPDWRRALTDQSAHG